MMALFKPAENTMAFLKAGFMGEAGSGKTHTATLVMIGLINHLRARGISNADKPVFMLDTEQGSAWVKPMFDEAGIELHVAKTRAFKDLVGAVKEAENNASGLFIDSVTHFWEDLQNSYMASRKRHRLEFQDWAVLKKMWRGFSDVYVNSELHCILCGRLGFEYEQYQDDNGKRQIEKSGVKMRAEKDLGYEPNMLVWMERDMDLHTKVVSRVATVLKDRSQRLDGRQFPNPTFDTFLPHVDFLALGGRHEAVDTTRNSEDAIPADDTPHLSDMKSIRRKIVLDEIEALLVEHYPTMTAEAKKAKADLIKRHFSTTSWTEISTLMPLVALEANFDALHRELEGTASRYGVQEPQRGGYGPQKNNVDVVGPIDEIPHMEPAAEVPAAEPDDRDIIVKDIETALAKTFNKTRLSLLQKEHAGDIAALDEDRRARIDMAFGKARARIEATKSLQAAE